MNRELYKELIFKNITIYLYLDLFSEIMLFYCVFQVMSIKLQLGCFD